MKTKDAIRHDYHLFALLDVEAWPWSMNMAGHQYHLAQSMRREIRS